jgi:hypothetical protein
MTEVVGDKCIIDISDDRLEKGTEKLTRLRPPLDAKLIPYNLQYALLLLDLLPVIKEV